MNLSALLPSYFQLWHLPVIFLAGMIGEGYGTIIGSGGILIQFTLASIGMPLQSVVATDLAGTLGCNLGVLIASPKSIWTNKKLLILLGIPFFIGGIVGTIFLVHISPLLLKYILILGLIVLLARLLVGKSKEFQSPERVTVLKSQYPLILSVMSLLGVYANVSGVGIGTFQKLVYVSILRIRFAESLGMSTIVITPAILFSFAVTAVTGLLVWPYLLVLWLGTFIGGRHVTKYVQKVPDEYLRMVLLVVVIGYLLYLVGSLL